MPGIDDFRESVTEMSDDDLNEVLNTTRNDRVKRKSKKKKSSSSSKTSESMSLDDIDDMTPEQARQMLEKLK